MKLCTIKSVVKKNSFQTIIILILLFTGGGMIASSFYRHYSPGPSATVNYDTIRTGKQVQVDSSYRACMMRGDKYSISKDYEKAITEYENGLKVKPRDPYATQRITGLKRNLTPAARQMKIIKSTSLRETTILMPRITLMQKDPTSLPSIPSLTMIMQRGN